MNVYEKVKRFLIGKKVKFNEEIHETYKIIEVDYKNHWYFITISDYKRTIIEKVEENPLYAERFLHSKPNTIKEEIIMVISFETFKKQINQIIYKK